MFDEIRFDLHLVVAGDDGEHVAVVYQSPMTLKDGTELSIGSMEIFRVVDGRITGCGTVATSKEYGSDRSAGGPRGGRPGARRTRLLPAGRSRWEGPATLMDGRAAVRELGFGTAFISERFNVGRRRPRSSGGLRRHQPDAHRDGRN